MPWCNRPRERGQPRACRERTSEKYDPTSAKGTETLVWSGSPAAPSWRFLDGFCRMCVRSPSKCERGALSWMKQRGTVTHGLWPWQPRPPSRQRSQVRDNRPTHACICAREHSASLPTVVTDQKKLGSLVQTTCFRSIMSHMYFKNHRIESLMKFKPTVFRAVSRPRDCRLARLAFLVVSFSLPFDCGLVLEHPCFFWTRG
jgi:hypothetical protein